MFPLFFCNDLCFICCLYNREVLFANCFCFVSELLKCEMIEKNDCTDTPKQQIRKSTDEASGPDEYRRRFLKERLSGSRRQTYIHDALYRTVAKLLPVIAPDMSVPMFLGSVLSDHLERYQDVINEIYNQEANQNPLEWKK